MAHDVLDLDDGIVHQHADHQRQRQQRDRIDRKTQIMHYRKRRNHRQRQGRRGDKGRAPVAQKYEYHQHRQQRALIEQIHRAGIVLRNRIDKIERLGGFNPGVVEFEFVQRLVHAFCHFDFTCTDGAADLKTHQLLAIEQGGRALFSHRILYICDLVQPYAPTISQTDLDLAQCFGGLHSGDGAHRLLDTADVRASASRFLLNHAQPLGNLTGGNTQRQQTRRIKLHTDLTRDTAHATYRAHTAHRQQHFGDLVLDKPGKFFLAHSRRGDGISQNWPTRQLYLGDSRVAQVLGQIGAHAGNCRLYVFHRFLNSFLQTEFDPDRHHAVLHLGIQMLQALHIGQRIFQLACHLGFQLRGRCAGKRGGNHHHRQFDIRELLYFHRTKAHQPHQREQYEQQYRRYRVADGPGGNVHLTRPFVCPLARLREMTSDFGIVF